MSVSLNSSVWYAPISAAISAARACIEGISVAVMPSGLWISSTSAPNARIVLIFSAENASELHYRSG